MAPPVKIYSTPTCVECKAVKAWLKQNSIAYEEVDVLADQDALNRMIERTGQMSVPVIEVGMEMIVKFDKPRLRKALGLA